MVDVTKKLRFGITDIGTSGETSGVVISTTSGGKMEMNHYGGTEHKSTENSPLAH